MDGQATLSMPDLMRRVMFRIMPLLLASFLIAFIDRQNVGFAKLTMLADTGMTEAAYALGASLFFIGYLAFEIPSALAVHKFGARIWIARIMLTWGAATIALAFTQNATAFYVLRFALGAAEAGFYPGALYYLTLWFPRAYRTPVLGVFTLGSALGNMLGAALSGPLLDLNGALNLAGWQWVFLGTGLPAIALSAAVIAFLPASPKEAKFLSEADKAAITEALANDVRDGSVKHGAPFAALIDPRVYGFALVYMLMSTAQYGMTYWMPTLVKEFGVTATVNGLLNMIPWALAVAMLLIVPRRVKGDKAIFTTVAGIGALGAISFLSSILAPENWQRFAALCVGAPCISLMYPFFWTFPPRLFTGARAAASIAAINSIGNLGGFFGQNLMPMIREWTGSASGPMLAPATCLTLLSVIGLVALLTHRSGAAQPSAPQQQPTL